MFKYLIALTDMSGLERYDVSNTKEMIYGFASSSTSNAMTYTSLESLANWNTSNLEDIDHIFEINRTITTLDGLEKWDVSKVKDMSFAFNYLEKVDNLDALSLPIETVRFKNGTRWNSSDGSLTYKDPTPDHEKTKIERVFRDEAELPLSDR